MRIRGNYPLRAPSEHVFRGQDVTYFTKEAAALLFQCDLDDL